MKSEKLTLRLSSRRPPSSEFNLKFSNQASLPKLNNFAYFSLGIRHEPISLVFLEFQQIPCEGFNLSWKFQTFRINWHEMEIL